MSHDDLMAEGFHRLDSNLLEKNPPRIKLLPGFYKKSAENQRLYLLRLASTMNHAAKLISKERDELVRLMVLKDEQLGKMEEQLNGNGKMLQHEVQRMNEFRQAANEHSAKQAAQIRELEAV